MFTEKMLKFTVLCLRMETFLEDVDYPSLRDKDHLTSQDEENLLRFNNIMYAVFNRAKELNIYDTVAKDYYEDDFSVLKELMKISKVLYKSHFNTALKDVLDAIISMNKIYKSDLKSEIKYDLIFSENISGKINQAIKENRVHFDYYDPDTTYGEDVCAFVNAMNELFEKNT